MSATVTKAIGLLELFSEDEPEIGLSEITRRSGINKASVYRMLTSLCDAGLIEQRPNTKAYALGAGILRLAQIREAATPISDVIDPALKKLVEQTGETAHGSLISGKALATIGIKESTRSTRVSLIAGEILPFHSTASGLVVLAFGAETLRKRATSGQLQAQTIYTMTDPAELADQIANVAANGFAVSEEENEEDVYGIAVPFFDATGFATGALAVATPCHRMTPSLQSQIVKALATETMIVTEAIGGTVPPGFLAAINDASS